MYPCGPDGPDADPPTGQDIHPALNRQSSLMCCALQREVVRPAVVRPAAAHGMCHSGGVDPHCHCRLPSTLRPGPASLHSRTPSCGRRGGGEQAAGASHGRTGTRTSCERGGGLVGMTSASQAPAAPVSPVNAAHTSCRRVRGDLLCQFHFWNCRVAAAVWHPAHWRLAWCSGAGSPVAGMPASSGCLIRRLAVGPEAYTAGRRVLCCRGCSLLSALAGPCSGPGGLPHAPLSMRPARVAAHNLVW